MKAARYLSGSLLLLLLACSEEERGTGPAADAGSGIVAGRLVFDNHEKASGVIVELTAPAGSGTAPKQAAGRNSAVVIAGFRDTTDGSGQYRFTGIPEGTYTLNARYLLPGTGDTLFLRPESFLLDDSIDLGVDTLYFPGAVSAGVFHDSTPIEDALCYIPGTSYDARTDKSGRCTIAGVPPGEYDVAFSAEGYLKESRAEIEVESRRLTALDTVFLAEDPALLKGIIAGTVVDASGNPLPGMLVVMSPINKSALTDDKGQYVFSDVPNAPQIISLGSDAFAAPRIPQVTIIKGQIAYADTLVAVNIRATTREVRGRLTGDIGRVAGVSIVLRPPSGSLPTGKVYPLGWDGGEGRYSGFIESPKQDSSIPFEIMVFDTLSRRIGYHAGTLKSNQGNLEIPVFDAGNALPRLVISGDSLASIGDSVRVALAASDPFNGSILRMEWDIGRSGEFRETTAGDTAFQVVPSLPAGYGDTDTLRLEVIARILDDDSNRVEETFTIGVVKDAPIVILQEDAFAKIGDSVRFHGIVNQRFGTIVRYAWDFDGDGSIDLETPGNGPRTFVYSVAGTYRAVLTVEDDDGNIASSSRRIDIQDSSADSPVVKVASSISHTLFLTLDGTLWAVGANHDGQLADGTQIPRPSPIRVRNDVADISVRGSSSYFITKDHKLYGAGRNVEGQLGIGSPTEQSTPILIMDRVAKVSAGNAHTLILTVDGDAYAVGTNKYAQLGDGTVVDKRTPVKIMSDVVDIAAGEYNSYFVKTDGSAWECGVHTYYQVPDESKIERVTPTRIMSDVSKVATGYSHTLLLDKQGNLFFKGCDNGFVKFEDLSDKIYKLATDVVGMSAGGAVSLFFKADRSLWGVGNNYWGAFGDGTGTSRNVPGLLMEGVSRVFAGEYGAFYVMNDGTLRASGRNEYGQLGDGTSTHTKTPVEVLLR